MCAEMLQLLSEASSLSQSKGKTDCHCNGSSTFPFDGCTHGTPWTVKVSDSHYESAIHHLQRNSEAQAINGGAELQPALLLEQ